VDRVFYFLASYAPLMDGWDIIADVEFRYDPADDISKSGQLIVFLSFFGLALSERRVLSHKNFEASVESLTYSDGYPPQSPMTHRQ